MIRAILSYIRLAIWVPAFLLIGVLNAQAEPFKFEEFFKGKTVAYGKFSAINGTKRSFKVDLVGTWNNNTLKLVEKFVYDDGVKETKTWFFTKTGPGKYVGKREDVKGVANVRVSGNTARYYYDIYLDGENRKNLVRFSDILTLKNDGTVRNVASVSKFGIPVGRVVVNFARPENVANLKKP